jgi:hypothetical protein
MRNLIARQYRRNRTQVKANAKTIRYTSLHVRSRISTIPKVSNIDRQAIHNYCIVRKTVPQRMDQSI